jgi:hypothetical protein
MTYTADIIMPIEIIASIEYKHKVQYALASTRGGTGS